MLSVGRVSPTPNHVTWSPARLRTTCCAGDFVGQKAFTPVSRCYSLLMEGHNEAVNRRNRHGAVADGVRHCACGSMRRRSIPRRLCRSKRRSRGASLLSSVPTLRNTLRCRTLPRRLCRSSWRRSGAPPVLKLCSAFWWAPALRRPHFERKADDSGPVAIACPGPRPTPAAWRTDRFGWAEVSREAPQRHKHCPR